MYYEVIIKRLKCPENRDNWKIATKAYLITKELCRASKLHHVTIQMLNSC